MSESSLFIPADVIRAATSNTWTPPDDAAVVGIEGEPGYRASWFETVVIRSTEYKPPQAEGMSKIFIVEVEVPVDSEVPDNHGRRWWEKFWVTEAAMKDKNHKDHDSSTRAIKNMTKFLKTLGVDTSKGYDPQTLFNSKDFIGQRLKVRCSIYTKQNGEVGMSLDRWATDET